LLLPTEEIVDAWDEAWDDFPLERLTGEVMVDYANRQIT
jgi:hypothetical protein